MLYILIIQKTNVLSNVFSDLFCFVFKSETCSAGLELGRAGSVAGQKSGNSHYVKANILLHCCCLLTLKANHMPTKTTAIKEINENPITWSLLIGWQTIQM